MVASFVASTWHCNDNSPSWWSNFATPENPLRRRYLQKFCDTILVFIFSCAFHRFLRTLKSAFILSSISRSSLKAKKLACKSFCAFSRRSERVMERATTTRVKRARPHRVA